MELDLSLGDASQPLGFLSKNRELSSRTTTATSNSAGLGFCMALGINSNGRQEPDTPQIVRDDDQESEETIEGLAKDFNDQRVSTASDPPVQLDLLSPAPDLGYTPSPSQGFRRSSDDGSSEGGSSGNAGKGFDVNRLPTAAAEEVSSPNSVASSFQTDFCLFRGSGNAGVGNRRNSAASGNDVVGAERASSRASDEDENLNCRKKLRLSKEQSAYLEESFKEHNILNPKQKLALAKQLSLSPRQVEVWFQNRRARTKLKQTEVDCEYLKRCCATLREENRRLHKELQELRALKSSNPFYRQLPATTLTMCPSCERVGTITSTAATNNTCTSRTSDSTPKAIPFPISRLRFFPNSDTNIHPSQSATS